MIFKLCKMQFMSDVHFGDGMLTDSKNCIQADTLFSALCIEIQKLDPIHGINKLKKWADAGELVLSDTFPFIGEEFYIPKPFWICDDKRTGDLEKRKYQKKLAYVPVHKLEQCLNAELDFKAEYEKLNGLGKSRMRMSASMHGLTEANPFLTGVFRFGKNNGLYFFVGCTEDKWNEIENVIEALSFTGIGGKISSGMGRFKSDCVDIPKEWEKKLIVLGTEEGDYMTLSCSLPDDNELERVISDAQYQIVKRSGFVAPSPFYRVEGPSVRKIDIYMMQAGSCFHHLFAGKIYNVSNGGEYPVYRYAKPIFWRLR